jgi:hypothetical protein
MVKLDEYKNNKKVILNILNIKSRNKLIYEFREFSTFGLDRKPNLYY